jgi:hypothetical protein
MAVGRIAFILLASLPLLAVAQEKATNYLTHTASGSILEAWKQKQSMFTVV